MKAGGDWDLDLAEDIKEEVESKYGKVDKLVIDKNSQVSVSTSCLSIFALTSRHSQHGDVFLKFTEIESAAKGVQALNGRLFAGKAIVAKFISEPVFKAHV